MSTVKELAQLIGVSSATVSRAMNGKPGLTDDLRAKILDEAVKLNVVRSSAARSLSTSRTDHVCFAVHHLPGPLSSDPFYADILMGVEQELRQAGMHTLLEVLGEEEVNDPARSRILRERRADGIILNGPFVPVSTIIKLHMLGIPLVLVDNFSRHAPVDAVVCDDRSGARAVADHILSLGHERVVVISGPEAWYSVQERCIGFLEAFASRGIRVPAVLHAEATTFETGQQLMALALEGRTLEDRPTAILAVNDVMAMGAIETARVSGLKVPDDLSITGFDDIAMASRWPIPLTTVQVQKTYLGKAAARQFIARLQDPQAPQQRIAISTTLVERNSSGPAPKGTQ